MGFVSAVKSGLRNRVNFSGRATRSEFWYWNLFIFLFSFVVLSVAVRVEISKQYNDIAILVGYIIILGAILPGFALMARRLHDLGRRGWWGLVFLAPFVGQLLFLVLMCLRGTRGPNRFGEDPLAK